MEPSPTPCRTLPAGAFSSPNRKTLVASKRWIAGAAVGAVADVGRHAMATSGCDESRDEPVICRAMHGRCESHDTASDVLIGEAQAGLLAGDTRGCDGAGIRRVLLGADPARLRH